MTAEKSNQRSGFHEQVEDSLQNAEQRLTQASLKAKLAHEKAANAVAEFKKEEQEAENALSEAKVQLESTNQFTTLGHDTLDECLKLIAPNG
uniref:Uncharacterized protein n=1 Tax=Schistosoma haematobium TaxID=6185 RepID=A0A095ANV4_SCHHA